MKYLKSYKIFESLDTKLDRRLMDYDILRYIVNDNGSIDCYQNTDLSIKLLNEIPFKFNKINGYFTIRSNKLTSLKNCPNYIDSYFECYYNQLTSLEFGPEYVGGDYFCFENKLTTLKGCIEEVYGDFNCHTNLLTSLEFCPMEVKGDFICSENNLEYLDRSPFIIGTLYCQGMFKTEPEFNGSCEEVYWR